MVGQGVDVGPAVGDGPSVIVGLGVRLGLGVRVDVRDEVAESKTAVFVVVGRSVGVEVGICGATVAQAATKVIKSKGIASNLISLNIFINNSLFLTNYFALSRAKRARASTIGST